LEALGGMTTKRQKAIAARQHRDALRAQAESRAEWREFRRRLGIPENQPVPPVDMATVYTLPGRADRDTTAFHEIMRASADRVGTWSGVKFTW